MKELSEQEQIENLLIIQEWEFDFELAEQNKDVIKMLELMKRHGEILRLRDTLTIWGFYRDSYRYGNRIRWLDQVIEYEV